MGDSCIYCLRVGIIVFLGSPEVLGERGSIYQGRLLQALLHPFENMRNIYFGMMTDGTDNAIFSTATEVWYDGVDQNCDGLSDYDQDGDGEDSVDHGGADCNDADNAIFSTATEIWYDGVDQNCDGGNDYDQDGDGEDSVDHGGADCNDTDNDG